MTRESKTGLIWLFAGIVCLTGAVLAATRTNYGSAWYGAAFVSLIWIARGIWILARARKSAS